MESKQTKVQIEGLVPLSYKPLLLKESNIDFQDTNENELTIASKLNAQQHSLVYKGSCGNSFFRPTLDRIQRATKRNKYLHHADTELIKSPIRMSINRYTRSVTLNEKRLKSLFLFIKFC